MSNKIQADSAKVSLKVIFAPSLSPAPLDLSPAEAASAFASPGPRWHISCGGVCIQRHDLLSKLLFVLVEIHCFVLRTKKMANFMCKITRGTAVVDLKILFADTACPFLQSDIALCFWISIIHEISFMYTFSSSPEIWKHKLIITIFLSTLERTRKLPTQIIIIHIFQSQHGRHMVWVLVPEMSPFFSISPLSFGS